MIPKRAMADSAQPSGFSGHPSCFLVFVTLYPLKERYPINITPSHLTGNCEFSFVSYRCILVCLFPAAMILGVCDAFVLLAFEGLNC